MVFCFALVVNVVFEAAAESVAWTGRIASNLTLTDDVRLIGWLGPWSAPAESQASGYVPRVAIPYTRYGRTSAEKWDGQTPTPGSQLHPAIATGIRKFAAGANRTFWQRSR